MISFKGCHHQQAMILQCVRWYVAYSLSYRDLEELMQERGYAVDHSTIQRWVVHYAPRIEGAAYEYPTLIQIIMASLARITSPVTTTQQAEIQSLQATTTKEAPTPQSGKERLEELKRLYDEGLIGKDVYLDKQRSILADRD